MKSFFGFLLTVALVIGGFYYFYPTQFEVVKNTILQKQTAIILPERTLNLNTAFSPISKNSYSAPLIPSQSNTVEAVYYFKKITDNTGFTCSGIKIGNTIKTITHCIDTGLQSTSPVELTKVENEENLVDDDTINPDYILIDKMLTISSNTELKFSIASADKNIVTANKYQGCLDVDCKFYSIKSTDVLGQGNSGSGVYDMFGDYAGAISMMTTNENGNEISVACPAILFNNPDIKPAKIEDRKCSDLIIFRTTQSFVDKVNAGLIEK